MRALVKQASRNHVGPERVARLVADARATVALTQCTATRRREIEALLARWALARAQADDLDARIAAAVARSPVATRLTTIPEVSALCAATIVAELGTPEGYEAPRQILKLAGMNLVVNASATRLGRARHSKRGRPMLRRQLFLLAGRWCTSRGLARAQYLAMVERNGRQKTKAVCAVARKLVRLIHAVIASGQPFDHARWLADHGAGPAPGAPAADPPAAPEDAAA